MIGLCMIVKDEAPLILRCLESVRPLIDYVLVHDTGSTDGTQKIIEGWIRQAKIPGKVVNRPWRDFGSNRSDALAELRRRDFIDYALVMDADDVLVIGPGFDPLTFKSTLTADVCNVVMQLSTIRYHRPQLISNRRPWVYRGVLHEFLDGVKPFTTQTVAGLHILAGVEGVRSRDPNKYRIDALTMTRELLTETDPMLRSRYMFYIANSWKDCGEHANALEAYLQRTKLGGWDQEIFLSFFYGGQMCERLNQYERALGMHLLAWDACPQRAESLHAAARISRLAGRYNIGHLFAMQGMMIPMPEDGLFVEPWVYDYGLLDELAVNAYWTGRYEDSLNACERLLERDIPDRERIEENARFAREKLVPPDRKVVVKPRLIKR